MKTVTKNRLLSLVLLSILVSTPILSSIPNASAFITTTGGTITFSSGYQIHTFTSSGTFQITSGSGTIEYLVIAGGAGGGNGGVNVGGGGGGGGYLNGSLTRGPGSYTVTVGAGGAVNSNGGNSVFDTITSTGGGSGGDTGSDPGGNGGSGGGGGATAGAAGSASPAGQGNNGGAGGGAGGGGGGGAGGAGGAGKGAGGNGLSSSITGSAVTRAGGGGGGDTNNDEPGGAGGAGGGGNGAGSSISCVGGTVNTGGGGGGGIGHQCSGGSGVVIVRFVQGLNAVTDLSILQTTGNSVTLDWTAPAASFNTSIVGYQINYTTPFGNPMTIVANNASASITQGTVSGLIELTPYSFRVTARTSCCLNATGNIANTTTLKDLSFGSLNLTQTNPILIPIQFERNDINDTALFLNVTYSNTFTLACDLHYKFAQNNRTYHNVASTTVGSEKHSAFQFNDIDNEIVDVFCWNQSAGNRLNNTNVNSTNSGKYIITQTNFLLLQQIRDFKAGEFGTTGDFGVIDIVTLVVIIIAMVGLNRVTESVGGIFVVAIVGIGAYFGIIDVANFMLSALAMVIMLIVGTTKKD